MGLLCLISFKSIHLTFKSGSLDKVVHVVFHFFFTFLWAQALKKTTILNALLPKIIFASIVYGITLEFAQDLFTTSRRGDFIDVVANIFGSLLAAAVLKLSGSAGN
jgi:VanZ family protein